MVETATFRQDAQYSDGRHPDRVAFSSAREDALRRDFTINGLFYDPVERRVIDFVGGQEDLRHRMIRAIGPAEQRFAEDKLRMLRAVRFSATLGFELEEETRRVVAHGRPDSRRQPRADCRGDAADVGRAGPRRRGAAAAGGEPGGGPAAGRLPPADDAGRERLERSLAALERLNRPGFSLALATLLGESADAAIAWEIGLRWRLANKETDRVAWLVEHRADLCGIRAKRWSAVQPLLICEGIEDLAAMHEAVRTDAAEEAAYCRSLLLRAARVARSATPFDRRRPVGAAARPGRDSGRCCRRCAAPSTARSALRRRHWPWPIACCKIRMSNAAHGGIKLRIQDASSTRRQRRRSTRSINGFRPCGNAWPERRSKWTIRRS